MIKFLDVSFSYDNEKILDNLSFNIKKGKWTTLLGKNGSGKSTITKLISALVKNESGEIFIDNKKYDEKILKYIRENVAVVFQNPDNQFIGSTVEEDIAFGLENRCVEDFKMDEIISKSLKIVDMEDFREYEPSKLSGGQKQRVALASALALEPKFLILDEALSMIDILSRKKILKYLKKVNLLKNLTILSITHDTEELMYSDEIIILDNKNISFVGNYKEFLNNEEIFKKYELSIPIIDKIKYDINEEIGKKIFFIEETEDEVIDKLCKLSLKT